MPSISRTNEFKEAVKGLGVPAGAQKKDLKGKGREVVGETRLLEGAGKDDPWNMEANKVVSDLPDDLGQTSPRATEPLTVSSLAGRQFNIAFLLPNDDTSSIPGPLFIFVPWPVLFKTKRG